MFDITEQDSIFETGYTTHHRRTGLRLTIVQLIAVSNGWSVDIETSREGGAKVIFGTVSVVSIE